MSMNETTIEKRSMTSSLIWMAAGMALSIVGLTVHNVREFGFLALFAFSTGTIPMIVIGIAIIAIWWRVPRARTVCAILMIGYGVLNLIGGGILSVLPLGFLPFEPEQSLSHYASHIVYSVTQIPLIWLGLKLLLSKTHEPRHEVAA